ncbi:cadherin domain-containing protein, partial [Flavobacteriaceae bacterium]|nr:cadherin domain-containing protein [Flavobacteriaceae bacterium]
YGQLPQASNLIGSYNFSGNADDSSGNFYNGSLNGNPSLVTDRNGVSNSAYSFDGNDYISTSDSMANQFSTLFTISAWIKSTNNATVDILGLGYQTCNGNAGPIIRLGANIQFNRCNSGFDTSNGNYYYDGVWHHYAFVFNGSQRKVYRDGNLINTISGSVFNITTYGLAIGRGQLNQSGNFFVGSMDDVNIWNVALTDSEINSVYNFSETTTSNPEISQTKIGLDNSTVSLIFSDPIYGGSSNATVTLEVSDFELSISGGSAYLSSSTPSSIIVSGTTISLGIPLSGTTDGDEILTILPVSNAIFSASGNTVSTTQSNNTTELVTDIVTDNLVLYLDASNKSSYPGTGTVWHDLSPNQNDGLISGTTFSSNGGEGFIFGGSSSDYITVADDTSLDMDNNQMTISYEITPDLNGSMWSPAIQKGGSASSCGAGTLNYYTWYGNNDFKIDFSGNSDLRGQLYNATSEDISNGKKIMITITVDQSNVVKTFINGELKHSLNNSGQVLGSSTNGPLVIGYCPDPSGKISSIMIYDRALTSQEVFQNYDALIDTPPSDISLSSNTISETSSIGSLIGTFSATDSDTSISNLTFSFTSSGDAQDDDNGSFTISGTSLLTSTTLDYETKTSYNIYVNVSDGTSNYAKAFTVSVTNVLEPVTDLGFEASNIVTDGLVLHLDASDSNSYSGSGNTWNDISGSGNNFNVGGATFSNSNFGHFNYNGQYSSSNSNINLTFPNGYSVVILMKYNSFSGGSFNYNNSPSYINFYNGNNSKLRWETKAGQAFYSQTSLNTGSWYLLTGTHQGATSDNQAGTAKLYINNSLDKSQSLQTNPSMNSTMELGRYAGNFNGAISAFLFYDKELSQEEVSKIYEFFGNRITGASSSPILTSTST